ncbi:MAG: PAS domain S-box protein [Blastocatellales bacterium]
MKERQPSVLIVAAAHEDRAALRDALLRDPAARYAITEAESGFSALELCRAWKPDCLILDHDLPDLSGLDALKKLTAEQEEAPCAVVALVGAGDAQLAVEAMKSGALDCLEKKGRAWGTELRRAVSQAIEKAEQRRQASTHEHELIEKNLALEADLDALRREAAARGREAEARQVARAGAGSSGAGVSRPERAFYNQTDALRNSETQLRAILDHSSASIFVKDLEGRFLRVNRMYEALHGATEAEVKGKTDHDIHAKEVADVFLANDREVIAANGPLQFEEQVDTVEGRRQYIALKFPLYDDSGRPYAVCGIATDITERKLAEDALKRSEERLNIAMHAFGVGMIDWDIRADSFLWSDKYIDIFGLPHDKTSGRYEDWRERVYPEDLPAVEAFIRGTLGKKLPDWHIEYRIVRGDNGEVRWIESRHHVFYDAQGAPLRTVGAVLDITERKRSEAALKLSEERLSLALKAAAIGTFDWDIPSGKHFLTEIGCAIFGLPLSNSTSAYEDWCKCVHPDDISDCEAKLQDACEHRLEELSAQYRLFRSDTGELRWIESRCRILYDAQGAPLRLIGTILDITDRVLAEEAIRESEARFRQFADALPQIVFTYLPDGLMDYGNQQWSEYTDVPAEQSTGRKWMVAVHPDDLENVEQRLRESVERGQRSDTVFRLRRRDGQYRWHMARALPIRDARGRIVKWIGTATDIHDRKQAESEREEALASERAARAEAEHAAESIRRLQAVTDSALMR